MSSNTQTDDVACQDLTLSSLEFAKIQQVGLIASKYRNKCKIKNYFAQGINPISLSETDVVKYGLKEMTRERVGSYNDLHL